MGGVGWVGVGWGWGGVGCANRDKPDMKVDDSSRSLPLVSADFCYTSRDPEKAGTNIQSMAFVLNWANSAEICLQSKSLSLE